MRCTGHAALVHTQYGLDYLGSLKACFRRELTLFARNRYVYIHRVSQVCPSIFTNICARMRHVHFTECVTFCTALKSQSHWLKTSFRCSISHPVVFLL